MSLFEQAATVKVTLVSEITLNQYGCGISRTTSYILYWIYPVNEPSCVDLKIGILEDAELVYKVREDMACPDWYYQYRNIVQSSS